MHERFFFIKVDLPEKENQSLYKSIKTIITTTGTGIIIEEDPHLTIEESSFYPRESVRYNLYTWLKTQKPLRFTLDMVDSFDKKDTGMVYLTMKDAEERKQMIDFHNKVHEIIGSGYLDKQHYPDYYIPHVALIRNISMEKINEVKSLFKEGLAPIKLCLSTINVREKRWRYWKDCGNIYLEGKNPVVDNFAQQGVVSKYYK